MTLVSKQLDSDHSGEKSHGHGKKVCYGYVGYKCGLSGLIQIQLYYTTNLKEYTFMSSPQHFTIMSLENNRKQEGVSQCLKYFTVANCFWKAVIKPIIKQRF